MAFDKALSRRETLTVLAAVPVAASVLGRPAAARASATQRGSVPLVAGPVTPTVQQVSLQAPRLSPRTAVSGSALGDGRLTRPFSVAGVNWVADGQLTGVDISIRTHSAAGWSRWTRLAEQHGGADPVGPRRQRRQRRGTDPVWTGPADGVDVRVDLARGAAAPADLRITLVDPGAATSDARPLAGPAAPRASAQGRQAAPRLPAPYPPVILRSQWGADESMRRDDPSYAPQLKMAFVHHTDTSNAYSPEAAAGIVRGIYAYHVQGNGWSDIGYNFLVDAYGRIYEGRFGGMDRPVIGAQTLGMNSGSMGVAMIGSFTSSAPPKPLLNGVDAILAWKFDLHRVNPAGSALMVSAGNEYWPPGTKVTLKTISGHRDGSATSCPGNVGYTVLPGIRERVTLLVGSSFDDPTIASAGYTVDLFGGIHEFGPAPRITTTTGWWPGQDVVRGIAAGPKGNGFVLDRFGGLHPFGSTKAAAPAPPKGGPYWPGWDIARAVALMPGSLTTGYVLDGWGGLHGFGDAPALQGGAWWPGRDLAVAFAIAPDGKSGVVLDRWGGIHPFGIGRPAPSAPTGGGWWPNQDVARAIVLTGTTKGYEVDRTGSVFPLGGAAPGGSWQAPGTDSVVAAAVDPTTGRGQLVERSGILHPFGKGNTTLGTGVWPGQDVVRGIVILPDS